jgi:hypothetical protein
VPCCFLFFVKRESAKQERDLVKALGAFIDLCDNKPVNLVLTKYGLIIDVAKQTITINKI